MVAHGARFSVYQIMLGHKMWAERKCEAGISHIHIRIGLSSDENLL
jgi:hypothetical protein